MYNATVILPGGNEGCHCGIPTLSEAGLVLVPPPSRSSLPRRRCRSSRSSQVNLSPAVLDPRPNERNPVIELGDTPETRPKCAPGHGGRGAAVSGKRAHRISTFPWRGG
ncbi:hypothetical protein K474DRAFT_1667714 [Panus rudis PR-1116 ss-1]|nr:hypothetical protein K474DRAFT_1667714 [Panus rudis PR-1116 ss-1]